MIIAKLFGGLGNQMFQYAAARNLSIHHHVPLKLDLSWFSNQNKRTYTLGAFQISEIFASSNEVNCIRFRTSNKLFQFCLKILQKLKVWHNPTVFYEKYISPFKPSLAYTSHSMVLNGYWQSERYFEKISSIIHHDFELRSQPSSQSLKIAQQIQDCPAVSIHIRRGDYIYEQHTNKVHGTCSMQYYLNAISLIKSNVPNPHFFIFSDDPEWTKQNLELTDPMVIISHNIGSKAYEDIWLMSLCRHQITANSSFSWWGAWLNKNPKKIVCAPTPWFTADFIDTRDLIPPSWIKISNK
jgi:hypothetical protein